MEKWKPSTKIQVKRETLVSYDVSALFTSMPVDKAIEVLEDILNSIAIRIAQQCTMQGHSQKMRKKDTRSQE